MNSEVGGNHLKVMSSFNHCVPKLLAGFVARRTPRGQNGNSACDNHSPNPRLVCYTSNELTLKRDFIFDSISFSTCSCKQMENLILSVIVTLATLFCNTGKVLILTLNALITKKLVKPRFARLFPSCWKGNTHCRIKTIRVSLIKTENLILQLFVFEH